MSIFGNETNCFQGGFILTPPGPKASNAVVQSVGRARDNNPATVISNFIMLYTVDGGSSNEIFNSTAFSDFYGNGPYQKGQWVLLQGVAAPIYHIFPKRSGWIQVGIRDYQPGSSSRGNVSIAPWGSNGLVCYLGQICFPGKYNCSANIQAGGYAVAGSVSPVAIPITLQLVSRDFTQIIDVTPPQGIDPFDSSKSGLFTIDSVALFGRSIGFFPQITFGNVSDPGLSAVLSNSSPNDSGSFSYGAFFGGNIIPKKN